MTRTHSLHPNSPSRCQHMEERTVNGRNAGRNALVKMVQCGLPRKHEGKHRWQGRFFGAPEAEKKT